MKTPEEEKPLPQRVQIYGATIEITPTGILAVEVNMGYRPSIAEVKEGCLIMRQMMDRPRPALFDIRGITYLDFESRSMGHTILKDVKFTAVALVIHAPITRLISKTLFSFTRRPYQREVFYDRNEALQWLQTSYDKKNIS